MPTNITLDQLLVVAPNIRSSYRDGFQNGQRFLDQYGISLTPLRVAHFMAQILHESGGLSIQFENLNYSAERLPIVWPSRFLPKGPLNPSDYAHNPQKIANLVYGGRMGNVAPDDGYTYRGRGFLQLTGKESYQQATRILQKNYSDAPDFAVSPDEVIGSQWCLAVAACEWDSKGCNLLADNDDIQKVTQAINGGQIGLSERIEWLKRTKAIWLQAS